MKFDRYGHLKPKGPETWYKRRSEDFADICPFSPNAKNENVVSSQLFGEEGLRDNSIGFYQSNYVGHVAEDNYRMQGSSGGLVTWVATELMRKNLVDWVAHVVAMADPHNEGRFFKYRISVNEKEVREGAKSRYYPVELSEVLNLIREKPRRYAIVAIPCMTKAIHLIRQKDPVLHDRIKFTLGLFCGHMKSSRFVETFAWQMKVRFQEATRVDYRYKFPDRPANWYNTMLTLKSGETANKDWWHLRDGDWGAGYFMNSACNFCDDVVAETADVSFGDAWVEPYSSDGRGTNVVIVRSPVIEDLIHKGIKEARLSLKEVSAEFVARTQAAGLRHRREGLAYRLTWAPKGIQPIKRVRPDSCNLPKARKMIYRMRYHISKWSHRLFWLAKKMKMPVIYLFWARITTSVYFGVAYHKVNFGEMKKRFRELKD
jgi:coenzyme F420-reducing hydrogenase beta subunit